MMKRLLIAMAMATAGWVAQAHAHGDVGSNQGQCLMKIGPDTMSFTGYQPLKSRDPPEVQVPEASLSEIHHHPRLNERNVSKLGCLLVRREQFPAHNGSATVNANGFRITLEHCVHVNVDRAVLRPWVRVHAQFGHHVAS